MEEVQTERRKSGRFKVGLGVVFIRSTGLPSVVGTLLDLGALGCKCRISLNGLRDEDFDQWNERLRGGRSLLADLSAQPFLSPVHLAVVTRYMVPQEEAYEVGLEFLAVETDERERLDAALSVYSSSRPVKPARLSAFVQPGLHAAGLSGAASSSGRHPSVQDAEETKVAGSSSTTTRVLKNWFASPEVPVVRDPNRGKRLGQILVLQGKVNAHDVEDAQAAAKAAGEKLGRYLLRGGWITPRDLCGALSIQTGLPMTDISELEAVPPKLAQTFSCLTLLRFECVPFAETDATVQFAATHPLSPSQIKELQGRSGKKIEVFLGEDDQVIRLLYILQPKKDRRLRKLARYKVEVPVSYRFFNRQDSKLGDEVFMGRTINISESGLLIGVDQDLRNLCSCLHVSFTFAPQQVEGLCSVRYVRKNDGRNECPLPFVVGLQIFDMTEESRTHLKNSCIRIGMWNFRKAKPVSSTHRS